MLSTLRTIAAGLDHAFKRIHVDLDPSDRATTFVAGTGRSGTAWAANIVNYDRRARYIFEPFNPYKVPECAGFRYRQYLRPDEAAERYVGPARLIVSGRIANDWIDQFNRAIVSRRRVVKEIRANLMLKWLKERFPGIRLIMMFRHPCADAYSRLRLGWQSHLDELLGQDALVADHLAPFVGEMRAARTPFEKHVFLWCVENYVPLRQLEQGDAALVFYEHLCTSPEREVEKLFGFLGWPVTDGVYRRLAQPSELTREESAVHGGGDLVEGWRRYVDAEQAARAIDILRLFGLDAIYSLDTSMPDAGAASALLGATTHAAASAG